MQLKDFLQINQSGLVADAVNFDMMTDEDKNLSLCQGFVFNYQANNPKSSTGGVLEALTKSYQNHQDNIHMLVQDYGKGKSHFGLVLANFFQQPFTSQEVAGILRQIEIATASDGGVVYEGLKSYKQRSKQHLVICLSGEKGDVKKLFLRALRQVLHINYMAKYICDLPCEYLEKLEAKELQQAEEYLESIGNPYGDVNALIQHLKQDNYQVISTVIEISKILTGGYPINFEADLDIESILNDLIQNYCTGENRQFEGILILLDELNAYLQTWAHNPVVAGGMALQNITNVCENNKGKIALMCFTQIRPSNTTATPSRLQELATYQKLTSRLELSSTTYEPISSLELVLSNLIIRSNQTLWQEFSQKWGNTLLANSRNAYDKHIPIYRERKWEFTQFHEYLGLKCFPLHPLTAYLLCHLDFTQGRTAIQFIKEDVKKFIQYQSVENDNNLNYIYPVQLVDAFADNFSNHPSFSDYQKAYTSVIAAVSKEEIIVLKGIFLFYASGRKLMKRDAENHEDILELLTGLPSRKLREALDSLCQIRRVIYKLPNNTYAFYSGINLVDLEQKIKNEVASDKYPYSSKEVLGYCQVNLEKVFNPKYINASYFATKNQQIEEDWQFTYQLYSISKITQVLKENKLDRTFAYIIADRKEELDSLRQEIDNLLEKSAISQHIVIAIPQQGVEDIAYILHKLDKLNKKTASERQSLGQAYSQLTEQYKQEIDKQLKELFKSCSYHCIVNQKITPVEKNNPVSLISTLLNEVYHLVPRINSIDKMASNSTSGSRIIGYASKQLLADNLSLPFPDKSYSNLLDLVFVSGWGLLNLTSQKYSVTIPTDKRIRAAWNEISQLTGLNGEEEKTILLKTIWQKLAAPPYGYNELTFTILVAAWLAYHHSEVFLKGGFGIPERKKDTPIIQTKPVKEWVNTNILDKPKNFVNIWIVEGEACLIRRLPIQYSEIPQQISYDSVSENQQSNYTPVTVTETKPLKPLKQPQQLAVSKVEVKDTQQQKSTEDLVNQILVMFGKLPDAEKISLYQKLAEYLP